MIEIFVLFFLVLLNYFYFSTSSLTKKAISFIIMVLVSLLTLPVWAGVLLMLLYVGGLFIVLTYIITFSFFQEKMTLLYLGGGMILLLAPQEAGKLESMSFFLFEPLFEGVWVIYPLSVLVLGLVLISFSTPSGKSIRGGL